MLSRDFFFSLKIHPVTGLSVWVLASAWLMSGESSAQGFRLCSGNRRAHSFLMLTSLAGEPGGRRSRCHRCTLRVVPTGARSPGDTSVMREGTAPLPDGEAGWPGHALPRGPAPLGRRGRAGRSARRGHARPVAARAEAAPGRQSGGQPRTSPGHAAPVRSAPIGSVPRRRLPPAVVRGMAEEPR